MTIPRDKIVDGVMDGLFGKGGAAYAYDPMDPVISFAEVRAALTNALDNLSLSADGGEGAAYDERARRLNLGFTGKVHQMFNGRRASVDWRDGWPVFAVYSNSGLWMEEDTAAFVEKDGPKWATIANIHNPDEVAEGEERGDYAAQPGKLAQWLRIHCREGWRVPEFEWIYEQLIEFARLRRETPAEATPVGDARTAFNAWFKSPASVGATTDQAFIAGFNATAEATAAHAEGDAGAWIEWEGGTQPVTGKVQYRMRTWSDFAHEDDAGNLRWDHCDGDKESDIIAYRAIAAPQSPVVAQEPVAWLKRGGRVFVDSAHVSKNHAQRSADNDKGAEVVPLYTTPQPLAVSDAMVGRFLSWKLPQTFSPDCGISFKREPDALGYVPSWPIGTNLFSAVEAREMLEHVLGINPAGVGGTE